jgi:diguanylate cyclase (GGDEF)-like protein
VRIGYLSAERARAEQTLRFEAAHDSLTGLANRRAFIRRLGRALSHDPACVIIFCDLNGFKRINDRLGHAAGDELLIEVAQRLRARVRENDLVCRFGGDEFLVLFPDSRLSDVERIRDRIVDAMSRPVALRSDEVTVGARASASRRPPRTSVRTS